MKIEEEELLKELQFKATLSSGPGGQHANKANTKVILEWNLTDTRQLDKEHISLLQQKLSSYITKENILQLSCEETRSQHQNKAIVTQRFLHLVKTGLKKPKKRKKPRPGKKFHKNRLEQKKKVAEKKKNRKDPLDDK